MRIELDLTLDELKVLYVALFDYDCNRKEDTTAIYEKLKQARANALTQEQLS